MLLEKVVVCLQKTGLDAGLPPYSTINSKWIKDLNIKLETLQLVHKTAGNIPEAIGIGKEFLNRNATDQQLREKMDKWEPMKLKGFCTTKEMVSKLK
jgi:hypothetical protein